MKEKAMNIKELNKAKKLLEKLERYEQEHYAGQCGQDWLESIGEGFKFYIEDCIEMNIKPTLEGFEKSIR